MMIDTQLKLKALHNSGLAVLNARDKSDEETIIIVGVPRSGTSMVASFLSACGVYVGKTADKAVFEDVELSKALEGGHVDRMTTIIAANNNAHKIWAFKRPLAFCHMRERINLFRNPRIIATFRDPVAICMRNKVSMGIEVADYLAKAVKLTAELSDFVSSVSVPVMLVSYEKAIFDPGSFAQSVAEFSGLSVSDETMRLAAKTIQNGPETYLLASQTTLKKAAV